MTKLLTTTEAQAALKLPRATFSALVARHNVKRIKFGKRVMYREKDLDDLILACMTPKRVAKV